MNLLLKLARLDWWVYIAVVMSFFSVALILNYLVKKINENRLEDRFAQLSNKISRNRSVQVEGRVESTLHSKLPLETLHEQSNPSTFQGISMVFNKDRNLSEEDRVDIKNFPNSNKLTTEVDIAKTSAEIDLTPKSSDIQGNYISPPPGFLGVIYKDLNLIERSKSLSNADRNKIDEIVNKTGFKKQESKSTPSMKKLQEIQNRDELKKWPINVTEKFIVDLKPNTSIPESNKQTEQVNK